MTTQPNKPEPGAQDELRVLPIQKQRFKNSTPKTAADICAIIAAKVIYKDGALIWIDCNKKSLNGNQAGYEDKDGYRRIGIPSYGMVSVHRLIFFMFNGYFPRFVDHIDGNPRNNKIENLRPATIEQNARNAKTPITNTSGRKGVYWNKSTRKWSAAIRCNDKLRHLGTFDDFNDAVKARESAEKEHHGEYAGH